MRKHTVLCGRSLGRGGGSPAPCGVQSYWRSRRRCKPSLTRPAPLRQYRLSYPAWDPPLKQLTASERVSAASGVHNMAASSVATPSVVRPRGGVRQSALGPFLARLRTETES